jgi:hypothetical protein
MSGGVRSNYRAGMGLGGWARGGVWGARLQRGRRSPRRTVLKKWSGPGAATIRAAVSAHTHDKSDRAR